MVRRPPGPTLFPFPTLFRSTIPGKAATCIETGLTDGVKCSVCGIVLVEQNTISKTGHTFGEWIVSKEATKTEDGIMERICAICGTKEEQLIPKLLSITIRNYVENRTVDYRTTVTFAAEVASPIAGGEIHWFVDGKDVGTGDSYTVKEAKKSYTLVAKYMQDGAVLAESEIETVTVKNGFFDKLKAFFRALFKKLPVLAQAFVGVETI